MHQWIQSPLVQVMVYLLCGTKLCLNNPDQMSNEPYETNFNEIVIKIETFFVQN